MTDIVSGESGHVQPASGPALQLRGINVVDVVGGEVRKTALTINEGRIVSTEDTTPAPETTILDLDGCWATPSLIDMHAHVTFEARSHDGPVSFAFSEPPELGAMRAVQNLTEALRNGICLVRDAGGRQSHLEPLLAYQAYDRLLLPELVTCGEPVCHPGGHGSTFGQELSSVDDIDELVVRHAAQGHGWLKIMNGPELWAEDELQRIVSRASSAGLRTAVHAFTPKGIAAAVRSGATTVEHGLASDPDVVADARRLGTRFVPTAYCSWISLRQRFIRTQPASEVAHLEYWFEHLGECQPAHVASGLPILPGTDAGCAPCSFDDYLDELAQFERWGLEPMAVLQSATIRAAECLGRTAMFGSVDVGKWANIIVAEWDPTGSTARLRQPLLVLYKGTGVVNTLGERWP